MVTRNSRHSSNLPARGVRVAELLQHELAQMIQMEVKDPRIGLVTLTGVELTADYAHATIYYTVLPDDEDSVKRSEEGLRRASGFMRGQIGRRVRIHTTPELHFKHDNSVARGAQMSALIDQASLVRSADDVPEKPEEPGT
jgi:ribosome-binding factor A